MRNPVNFLILTILILTISSFAQDTISNLQIEKRGTAAYVDGVDLAKKLNEKMLWQGDILRIGNSSWVLGNSWASAKDTAFQLQSPVQNKITGKVSFWLPLPSSLKVFERMQNKTFEYDSASAKIISKPSIAIIKEEVKKEEIKEEAKEEIKEEDNSKDIISANLEAKNNGEILEIKLSKPFTVEPFQAHSNYILRINGAIIESVMFQDITKKSAMISRIIPIQDAQSAQLTLSLKDNCEGVELLKKDGGKTLQVVLRKKAAAKTAAAPPPKPADKKTKTIVIDPGHGGKDPGAIGNGLKEKDIVLSVGLKLKKKLEEKGFAVKLTRETDVFVELERRPKMASDWGGDLFVSLHCDAIPGTKEKQQKIDGFKFYILRAGGSEEDKALARRENQAIALESGKKGKDEISPAEWIVLDNQLALYAERSALLAGHLVEAFDGGSIRKTQTGAGQAGFMVLVGAYMPAVLAELGFITNQRDSEILASEKGQNESAERLTKAIVSFFK